MPLQVTVPNNEAVEADRYVSTLLKGQRQVRKQVKLSNKDTSKFQKDMNIDGQWKTLQ